MPAQPIQLFDPAKEAVTSADPGVTACAARSCEGRSGAGCPAERLDRHRPVLHPVLGGVSVVRPAQRPRARAVRARGGAP